MSGAPVKKSQDKYQEVEKKTVGEIAKEQIGYIEQDHVFCC